jgi:diguanylate cyclase (GGDEF)-like protein
MFVIMAGGRKPPADDEIGEEVTRPTDFTSIRAELFKTESSRIPVLLLLEGMEVGRIFKLTQGTHVIGRAPGVDIQLLDPSLSRRHARVIVHGTILVLEDLGSANGLLVNGEKVPRHTLVDGDKIRLGDSTLLRFCLHDETDESFQETMYDLALRDALTRAFNRKHFALQLAREVSYARRHKTPLSVLMVDIDHFKSVNDQHGHLCGDAVLVEMAKRLQSCIRHEDILARYGGEEFVLVLRGIRLAEAGIVAERLRRRVADTPFEHDGKKIPLTVSVGGASFAPGANEELTLIAAADAALYAAKNAGRNRVKLAEHTREPR